MNDSEGWVGRRLPRKEDRRLLRGRGRYHADIPEPSAIAVHFVRSTHAHARLRHVDVTAARALAGVEAVVTGADVAADVPELLIPAMRPQLPGDLRVPPSPLLAADEVVFAGEPMVMILARDEFVARDAAELVEVSYEDLPVVLDPESALDPDSPRAHSSWPDNMLYELSLGEGLEEVFDNADVVVRARFEVPRTGTSPMEPRGVVARWDDGAGLDVRLTTQRPHIVRLALSELLDIPHHQVHVTVPPDQGGGFGCKAPVFREEVLVSWAARRTGLVLRWTETREEHFLSGVGQERGQIHHLELAAARDGRILGLRDDAVVDTGVGNETVYLGFVMAFLGVLHLPNAYDIPAVGFRLRCPVTNKPALVPSRAFGEFPTRFAVDRLIDDLAHEIGVEAATVRRQNLIAEFPHTTATGLHYDSGDFRAGFDALLEAVDLPGFRAEQQRARAEGRYLGIGFAVGAEMSGLSSEVFVALENQPGFGAATVTVDPRGTVRIGYGDVPQGHSHETTLAQVVADELGLTPEDVALHYGDTWTTPFGSGTVGNRTASYTVSAAVLACRRIRTKMAAVTLHDWGLDASAQDAADEFGFVGGELVLRADPERRLAFAEVARRLIMTPVNLPDGMEAGLESTAYFEPDVPGMYSCGYHAAVVEVEPETGELQILRYVVAEDCGRRINPLVVEGQVHGGLAQGIGNTLFEEFCYDADGRLETTTLADYLMPSAADLITAESIDVSVPTPHTPLGTKGKGEGVPGPVPGALGNAVSDALAPFGVRIDCLPLRPERIWEAIRDSPASTARESPQIRLEQPVAGS